MLKAGPLTNAVALGGAIAAVLLLVPAGTGARRAAAALLLSSPASARVLVQSVIRNATWYFETDVRLPGVSPAGIALSASSPRL